MAEAELKWNPEPLMREIESVLFDIFEEEGREGVKEIRENFTRGVSEPGQPPGIKTGRLYRAMHYRIDRASWRLEIGASNSVPYAIKLEFGDPSQNLRPRPYLAPQRKRTKRRVIKKLKARISV